MEEGVIFYIRGEDVVGISSSGGGVNFYIRGGVTMETFSSGGGVNFYIRGEDVVGISPSGGGVNFYIRGGVTVRYLLVDKGLISTFGEGLQWRHLLVEEVTFYIQGEVTMETSSSRGGG